ncbi:hypothetical protein TNCV_645131 [Trichonephila clavipes]|nr:hypothetical protein TNCV_645131 [Trichonephila clavipes]
MARRNHLYDFTRGRMIGKLEEGRTVTSVAAELRINKSVISRAWRKEADISQQASLLSNSVQQRATSVVVYCGQTPSQRRPIRPPS